ncbi:iron-siderophore ABC transporter substrate-binding protein [Rhodococcus triatomae]|uniref:Iron complex transport system substrate-binding protein n=1 Tax=Rhodococcus triatomae TaxID=300028 RepID=A0A1G8PFY3_9NOCA|nr:iron-siderophore ABC transporter substrate-binding protein [Rhodococcus triatomae]QNG20092.1 iron-siderophore ABC transporter substrate-binding protein [Rhodococcus triatomae]QNG23992.1 iron-siderophore ABC transporter substrate-binding protein [Rhodococcus triatomae]SDI91393.1 iron complex transport system substrate-binding protein [Rhodococcus triatomae]
MRFARSRSARLAALSSGLMAVALVVAGCGTADDADEARDSDFETVTIEHALGRAVVTEEPERIVTLGMGSAETAIALGTVPVGVEEYAWGSDDTGYLPWIHEAVTERGDELPVQFTGGSEIDIESIAALEPDLILAPWSGITQEHYDALSALAPTVAYAEKAWTTTWEEQMRVIGAAMGKSAEAEQEIEKIRTQFTDAAAAHPEYADVSFSFVYNTGPGTLGVFFPEEQRVAMVRALGLTVDPVVETLPEKDGTDSAVIGLENAHLLDNSDLLFTFYSDAVNRAETEAQPVYAQIPAVARGSVVAPTEQAFVTGSSIINPLTVPWSLERYVPLIDQALEALPEPTN